MLPRAESHEDALQQWNDAPCEILEIGETQGTAQWYLVRDTIVANAAAKNRAIEKFAAEYELEGDMLMGPRVHTPHKMRRAPKKGRARGSFSLNGPGSGESTEKLAACFATYQIRFKSTFSRTSSIRLFNDGKGATENMQQEP